MPTLSSRPLVPSTKITQQDVMEAAQPSINIVSWLARTMKFQDDHPRTVRAAQGVIEEALDCMVLRDYAVLALPSIARHLAFEIALQPLSVHVVVYFNVQFDIL